MATWQHLRMSWLRHYESSNWHSIVSEDETIENRKHSFINLELNLSKRSTAQCPESSKCISIFYTIRWCLDCNLFRMSECTVRKIMILQIQKAHEITLRLPKPLLKFIGCFLSAGHLFAPENGLPLVWATERLWRAGAMSVTKPAWICTAHEPNLG